MSHQYTAQQLDHAMGASYDITGDTDILEVSFEGIRAFLDALPETGKTYITNVGIQQQIGRLQDLTSSANEAVIWLSTLNHLVATGADRERILKQDTQDGWQECAWGDILHADERVKAEYISGTVIEGVPDGISDGGICIVDGNFIPFSTDARWYRIPAPVVHPDPAEHPAIVVTEADGYEDTNPQVFIWTGNRYENNAWSFDTDDITNWKPINPAKVVADNDC